MPAPRACRSCGAALATRRCPHCGIEATEFTARPPLHDDDYVGEPSHLRDGRGYHSRWEASATTFGPGVRIGATVFLLAFLAVGFFALFFILWFVQLFVTAWLLKEIWRRGWIVPAIGSEPTHTTTNAPDTEPIREGLRVPPPPERLDPVPERPRTSGEIVGLVLIVIAGGALVVVFTFGSDVMRVGAIMPMTLLGMYAFFRSFLT